MYKNALKTSEKNLGQLQKEITATQDNLLNDPQLCEAYSFSTKFCSLVAVFRYFDYGENRKNNIFFIPGPCKKTTKHERIVVALCGKT